MKRIAWAVTVLLAVSCQNAPSSRSYEASPEKLAQSVRAVLAERGQVNEDEGILSTGWQEGAAFRESWNQFGRPLRGESRYRVRLEGSRVEVTAHSRAFVSFGPHALRWEPVNSAAAEARLMARVQERLGQ